MQNTSNFQLAVMIFFTVFLVVAILIFTGIVPGFRGAGGDYGGEVTVWGTIPEEKLRTILENFNRKNKNSFTILYEEQNPNTYETDLIEALAAKKGPDLFLLPQDLIVKHRDKVFPIPFKTLSERDFRDTFVEEGELYITKDGILGLPFRIDPLVLYYNRGILSSFGIARAPVYWDEFLSITPRLSEKDTAGNITRGAIALGEFSNIIHAKEILSLLMLQAGADITKRTENGLTVALGGVRDAAGNPAESALRFFSEFSNPSKPTYSWNRSLPEARDMFTGEDLAFYIGYASELNALVSANPHLNFDVARMPQIRDNKQQFTFGAMDALVIAKNSDNIQTALRAAFALAGTSFSDELSKALRTPPARRDLLAEKQKDAFNGIFYESALLAEGWLDPNPKQTYTIFRDMVEGVSSGRFRVGEAVRSAAAQMNRLIQ